MKKHFSRAAANGVRTHIDEAVEENLPFAMAKVLVTFAETDRPLTADDMPMMRSVVTRVLRYEAERNAGSTVA